ncbi:LTA synthase family protein [Capnocytophaga sp. ARDL2]|uniref:LTA synthase family protein n=1 Tax=Capnocytophaga sp. ARDL2 TaxID=3238809 RepID=UPI0035581832
MIKQLLKIHLLSLSIFFIFRLLLLFSNTEHWTGFSSELLQAFVMGIRFDTVINGYILALPTLQRMILFVVGKNNQMIQKFTYWYCAVFFTLAYTVSAFDIPFFNQFFNRLDATAFQWIENPAFVVEMAVKDFRLWGYAIPFIVLMIVFHVVLRKIFNQKIDFPSFHWSVKSVIAVLILGGTFLGIRGRIEGKSPIRVGTAFFCNHAFYNKLGLNPNFTLLNSLTSKKDFWIDLMTNKEAFVEVSKYMDLPVSENFSVQTQLYAKAENFGKPNIVLVLMESMTTQNLKHHGNTQQLTPNLDALIEKSIYFENAYSAGIHTHNGIFSSLYSYPALWNKHALKQMESYPNNTILALNKNGYSTIYFTTHDSQFDNVEGFLLLNDFQKVYSQKDYPTSEVKSNLGVVDDYLFSFSIEKMNELHKNNQPFFCTLMTASNHAPIIIPEHFSPKQKEIQLQAIEYSDWAIGQFLQEAEKQPWFDNTIFVFIGDHGNAWDTTYEMSLSYHSVPLIFYAPKLFTKSEIKSDFAQQIDVMPSILGLTSIDYTKQNMGIDLWKNTRPFAYFSANDKVGVINEEFYYIYKKDGSEALYKYRTKDTNNYLSDYPELAKEMNRYFRANYQLSKHSIQLGNLM